MIAEPVEPGGALAEALRPSSRKFPANARFPGLPPIMAARAMNRVRVQPTREIAPIFHERQDVSAPRAMPLPPENYRGENSLVVSYPVDENSMISGEDILFLQGSPQFSDPYSYEVVGALADAMKDLAEEERFVIEGHASAEGGYDSNMVLSQQRAEHVVREIVRRGVSPYRLLPVGYSESEARRPADAPRSPPRPGPPGRGVPHEIGVARCGAPYPAQVASGTARR